MENIKSVYHAETTTILRNSFHHIENPGTSFQVDNDGRSNTNNTRYYYQTTPQQYSNNFSNRKTKCECQQIEPQTTRIYGNYRDYRQKVHIFTPNQEVGPQFPQILTTHFHNKNLKYQTNRLIKLH